MLNDAGIACVHPRASADVPSAEVAPEQQTTHSTQRVFKLDSGDPTQPTHRLLFQPMW